MRSNGLFQLGRRAAVAAGAVAVVLTGACSDSSTAPQSAAPATSVPSFGKNSVASPVIDGVMSPGEWDSAAKFSFRVMLASTQGAVPATVYVTHDRSYLYLVATFDRTSPFHANDIVGFEFDNDNDGVREDGDDIVFATPAVAPNTALPGGDYYRLNGGAANQSDVSVGGTNDVLAAWGAVGTTGVFEIRHPLNDTDNAHDFSIVPTQTVGMLTQVSLETDPAGSNVWVHTLYPTPTTYCQLTIAKKSTSVTCP